MAKPESKSKEPKKKAAKKEPKKAKKVASKRKADKPARNLSAKGGGRKMNLSPEQVAFIRTRAFLRTNGAKVPGKSNDLTHGELATKFKCSKRSIYNIAAGLTYTPDEAAAK